MSLIAWYPFTKDVKNRGLSDDATFNGTVNFLSSQFGYGLDLSKGNNVVIPELANLKTFSIAFWVKIFSDSSLSANWVHVFGIWDNNSEDSDSGSFRWQTGYGDPYVTTMGIGGPYNSPEQNICANMGIMTSEKNVWHHICVVVDYENDRVTSYLNGTVKNTTTHNGGHIWTGRMDIGSTNTRGVLNDLRIYDHALSTKEIKELAKGLILHHDLKGYGANPNLITKNEVYAGDGSPYYVYKDGPSTSTVIYLQTPQMTLEKNTDYTLSFDVRLITDDSTLKQYIDRDLYPDDLPQSDIKWSDGATNQWKHYTWTMSSNSDSMLNARVRIFTDNTDTASGNKLLAPIEFRNIKFEKGSHETPFIPSDLPIIDIEDDLSGNGFNGTRQGVTFTSDSPRYYMSTEFDANKDLLLDRIFHQNDEVSNLSVSIWVKFKGDTSNPNIWSLNDSNFIRIEKITNTNQIQISAYMNNGIQYFKATFNETVEQNKWYHLVLTFDKGIFKFYANNVLINTTDKTSVATTLKCLNSTNRWSLGDYNGGNDLVGNLSDFRIYAKTLTADEVTELYKVGAQVDKTGKLYCGELVEE